MMDLEGQGAAGLLKMFITFTGRHAPAMHCTVNIEYLKNIYIYTLTSCACKMKRIGQ